MESWNVVPTENPGEPYFLQNSSQTVISFSKRIRFDISTLLVKMEEWNIPLAFCDSLKEIKFTILSEKLGWYQNGVIALHAGGDWGPRLDNAVCQTFVHELGHHVDEAEAISEDPDVIDEKRLSARFMPDDYARKSVIEYVACGFEVYYLSDKKDRKSMREKNKVLYNRIAQVHRKYRAR